MRLPRWPRPRPPASSARWIVVDVESSGLDPRRDRLLAIAALALHVETGRSPAIALGDSFEVVLHQAAGAAPPDKRNILLHGIGVGAQRAGVEAGPALQAFEEFVGDAPLLAFHAAFDRTLIDRACAASLGRRLANPWIDIEPLAAVAHPQGRTRSLDEWMDAFGIRCVARHQAAADVLATAELLLRLWPGLQSELRGRSSVRALAALAAQQRWLRR